MAVVKNGPYWFYEWKVDGKVIRRSSGLRVDQASREEVRQREIEARRRALEELGIVEDAPSLTLEKAIERYYEEKWSRDRSGERQYKNAMAAASIIGRKKPLDEITSKDLAHLKATLLERGKAGSTVNRYISAIMVILNTAARYWDLLDRVPAVKREDETGNERLRVVTWEEEKKILEACDSLGDQDFKDLYIVLVDSGLRCGEALEMTYTRNIDFHNNVITIQQQKTKRSKTIPMTERVQEVLTRRKALGDKPFACFSEGAPLKRLRKVLEAAGLSTEGEDAIVIHSLRHTFAARLANAGVPIYEVSKLLGHTSVKTTERYYAHLFTDRLRDSISVLERAMSVN